MMLPGRETHPMLIDHVLVHEAGGARSENMPQSFKPPDTHLSDGIETT